MAERVRVQRKRSEGGERAQARDLDASLGHDLANPSRGEALESRARAFLEPRFGHSFADVRVHADGEADRLAQDFEARAFTTGQDIFFRSGAYAPGSPEGMHLLTHELAHTIQQAAGPVDGREGPDGTLVSDPGDPFERAAERAADGALSNQPASPVPFQVSSGQAGATVVQRTPEEEARRRGESLPGGVDTDATAPPGPSPDAQPQRQPANAGTAASARPPLVSVNPDHVATASNIRNAAGNAVLMGQHYVERAANQLPSLVPNPNFDPGRVVAQTPNALRPTITGTGPRNPGAALDPAGLAGRMAAADGARSASTGRYARGMAAADGALTYIQARSQGQGQAEAAAGALASASTNRAFSASPADLAINTVNAAAQVAGAPQGVQDTLGVVASATPSSSVQSTATHAARAVPNLIDAARGDSSGVERQNNDIRQGRGGAYPLQGYGILSDALDARSDPRDLDVALNRYISSSAAANRPSDPDGHGPVVAAGNHIADTFADSTRGASVNPHRGVRAAAAAEQERERERARVRERLDEMVERASSHQGRNREF